MENNQNNESYKKLDNKCRCGCGPHCGHGCLDCDYCSECDCPECRAAEESRGYN